MKILIIDGNTKDGNAAARALGMTIYCEIYAELMHSLALTYLQETIEVDIAHPSEIEHDATKTSNNWFASHNLMDFDGFIWTGSPLHLYDESRAVKNQLKFGEKVLKTGKPVFGSCWGLQINTHLLGGRVRKNPKGREIGIARNILIHEEAINNILFKDKPRVFNALAIHLDEIEHIPAGADILASNGLSSVQAMQYQKAGVDFYGVQYHPEFNFSIMAFIYKRISAQLIEEGFCKDEAAVTRLIEDYHALSAYHDSDHTDPRPDLAFIYGTTACVTNLECHRRELINWLHHVKDSLSCARTASLDR